MPKIGVVLAGCGVFDGAEVHESVITLLALDRGGAEVICMAPDVELEEIDHLTQQATGAKRSVLKESARIARGEIKALADVAADDLDALVFPGGFGAAKNLSDFASKGPDATVQADVAKLVLAMHQQNKPIGAACIAPATIAAIFKGTSTKVNVTIGNDPGTAKGIEACGAAHTDCAVEDIVVDEANKLVTTPAYMLGPSIKDVAAGIDKMVGKILQMVG